jgi:hypothetical protein
MSRTSKADLEAAEDLENTPFDDPSNYPEQEPQPRCLYDDCMEPGIPVGYSSLPAGVSVMSFSKAKYPQASEAIEAFDRIKRNFLWWDDVLYWTNQHWFFRFKK